jgi:hypothetical protein
MSVLEEIGRSNWERTRYMKEKNDYNGVMIQQNAMMLKMADEKHAVRREMDFSNFFNCINRAYMMTGKNWRDFRLHRIYDTDSSETREAKCHVLVLSNRYTFSNTNFRNTYGYLILVYGCTGSWFESRV